MGLFNFISEAFSNSYTDKKGYKRFWDSNKPVHRYVAEKKLGRKLTKGEVVHHIDRDKSNNARKNLWVFSNQEEHNRVHKFDAKRYGNHASYRGFKKKKNGGIWDFFK